jgi:hypothetical protein
LNSKIEGFGYVSDVNVVALEVLFEENNASILAGAEREIVDEKIESHSGRDAKYSSETEGYRLARRKKPLFALYFQLAVERNGLERRFFRAEGELFSDSIAAVRIGVEKELVGAYMLEDVEDGVVVELCGEQWRFVTGGRSNDRCERDDDVGFFYFFFEERLIASVSLHKAKGGVGEAGKKGVLLVVEIIDHCDEKSFLKEVGAKHGANVARSPCN